MKLPDESEWRIRQVVIGDGRNKERPDEAIDLLDEVARYLETHCGRHPDGGQRFTVDDIVLNLYQGLATIYLRDQD